MTVNLRPDKLSTIIGQDKTKHALKITVAAAKKQAKALPHILFQGPPGLGKSTFGHALANEMGSNCVFINGATVTSPKPLIKALAQAQDADIVFIDEMHALPRKIAEMLYMPMEEGVLAIQERIKSRILSVNKELNNFTIIGATTHAGLIPKPLVDRMGLQFQLEYYSIEELEKIIDINCKSLQFSLDKQAINNVAIRCKNTPRLANKYCRWLKDYCVSHNVAGLTVKQVDKAFNAIDIDENGLDNNDRLYLKVLAGSHEPLGLNAIVSISGLPKPTIEDHIEPFLLRTNRIEKTKQGRQVPLNLDDIDKFFMES